MKRKIFRVAWLSCGLFALWLLPVAAQAQYPYAPPPMYYQSYYPQYQPYLQQPGEPPVGFYAPAQVPQARQSTYCGYRVRSAQEQMYRCGLSLVYARRYHEAIQVLHNFLRYYPSSSLADNALYWIGESYYAKKQYWTALTYFQRVRFEYPRGNKVPDAMLKIALAQFSLKQYEAGCRGLDELIAWYPRSESASKAYYSRDRCYRPAYRGYVAPDYRTYDYSGYSQSYCVAPDYRTYDYSRSARSSRSVRSSRPSRSYGDAALPKNW